MNKIASNPQSYVLVKNMWDADIKNYWVSEYSYANYNANLSQILIMFWNIKMWDTDPDIKYDRIGVRT